MEIYVAIVASFALGYFIGVSKGKSDATKELVEQQARLEATRMWTSNLKNVQEAFNVERNS